MKSSHRIECGWKFSWNNGKWQSHFASLAKAFVWYMYILCTCTILKEDLNNKIHMARCIIIKSKHYDIIALHPSYDFEEVFTSFVMFVVIINKQHIIYVHNHDHDDNSVFLNML